MDQRTAGTQLAACSLRLLSPAQSSTCSQYARSVACPSWSASQVEKAADSRALPSADAPRLKTSLNVAATLGAHSAALPAAGEASRVTVCNARTGVVAVVGQAVQFGRWAGRAASWRLKRRWQPGSWDRRQRTARSAQRAAAGQHLPEERGVHGGVQV